MEKEKYSDIVKENILNELYSTKKPQSTIAKEFGVSESSIRRWVKADNLKRNQPIKKYFKMIGTIGIFFSIFGFIFFYFKRYIVSMMFLLITVISQIPDGYYVWIKYSKDEKWSSYNFLNFIKLIVFGILCIFGIVIMIMRNI